MASESDFYFPCLSEDVLKRHRHWEIPGATYFITFRLADSLPAGVVAEYERERRQLQRELAAGGSVSNDLLDRARRIFTEKLDKVLDSGIGACQLRHPQIADCVRTALLAFHGERYDMRDWCIMPNHVHVLISDREVMALDKILHSWKSYTSHEALKITGGRAPFWQREYYDHIVRSYEEYLALQEYVLQNPAKAHLKDWPHVGSL